MLLHASRMSTVPGMCSGGEDTIGLDESGAMTEEGTEGPDRAGQTTIRKEVDVVIIGKICREKYVHSEP